MNNSLTKVCLLAFAGCTTVNHGDNGDGLPEEIMAIVREHAFREQATLNPTTQIKIEEYHVEGLEEAMGIQLLFIRYLSPDGEQFNERMQVYRDGSLVTFGSTFGGFGLMSAAMHEDRLFYTYSWGSGIHRSHVGTISIEGDQLQFWETIGFVNQDLFVRSVSGDISVEVGSYLDFNSWEKSDVLGGGRLMENSLSIIDHDGNEIGREVGW